MANFHSDKYIMSKVKEHWRDANANFKNVIAIFAQGSVNYGMDYEGSDVDTIALVAPSLYDISTNQKPISVTHIRENDEHIEVKDIRLFLQMLRKQNPKYLEVLCTEYFIVKEEYADLILLLMAQVNSIAFMNPVRAIKSIQGIMAQKDVALYKPYPSQKEVVEKYGYAPKQLHHIVRMHDHLYKYIKQYKDGTYSYKDTLVPISTVGESIKSLKIKPRRLNAVAFLRDAAMNGARSLVEEMGTLKEKEDEGVVKMLEQLSYEFIKKTIVKELGNGNN